MIFPFPDHTTTFFMLPSSNLASNQQNSEASGSEAPNSQAHPSTPFQAGATQPDTTQSEQAESSTMSRQNSEIYIQAAANIDFPYLAYLEYLGFANDAFSAAAFGAYRAAEDNLLKRAINMAEGPGTEGKTIWFVKAVNDRGEIVGFAAWERGRFPSGKARSGGEEMWGSGANVRLCNDTFLRGDESMGRACAGRDYQSMSKDLIAFSFLISRLKY